MCTLGSPRRKRRERACHAIAANVLASTTEIHSENNIDVAVRPMMREMNKMDASICETYSTGLFASCVLLVVD